VWGAGHGSQYRLAVNHMAGQPYDARTFVDPEGFLAEVTRLEQLYLEQVASEQQ
jgi:hypothetical protein